jgi:hypothetical protein
MVRQRARSRNRKGGRRGDGRSPSSMGIDVQREPLNVTGSNDPGVAGSVVGPAAE